MFEITFRTEDKATWQKLLAVLGSLDLPLLRKDLPNTNGEAKNAGEPVGTTVPLQEKTQENSTMNGLKEPVHAGSKNQAGGVEFSKEYLELLKNYNPNAGDASVGATGKPIPAISFAEWAGIKPDPEKFKPGFGCMKGMFIMSDDFDEPLEDFKEYMP